MFVLLDIGQKLHTPPFFYDSSSVQRKILENEPNEHDNKKRRLKYLFFNRF
jgi:hypothetical protein